MGSNSKFTPIVAEFFKLFASLQEGLDYINELTGRSYKHSHIYTWCKPDKPNPAINVYDLMIRDVLRQYGYHDVYDLVSVYTVVEHGRKSPDVFAYMKEGSDPTVRIVGEFFALYQTKQEALDYLNAKTGKSYKHNHIYSWANPSKGLPLFAVYELMVRDVLNHYGYHKAYSLIRHLY